MWLMAICPNVLAGFGARYDKARSLLLLILLLIISIAFLLIADIDSPRGGLVRVHPPNLVRLFEL